MKSFFCILAFLFPFAALAQGPISGETAAEGLALRPEFRTLSFGVIPAWTGLLSGWPSAPVLHVYDSLLYQGHATFVSRTLEKGIDFKDFTRKVRVFSDRRYLPVHLYDLKQKPFVDTRGHRYAWALQVVNYDFEDTPGQMGLTVAKAMETVSAAMLKEGWGPGVFLVDYSFQSPFYAEIRQGLEEKGFAHSTLSSLLLQAKIDVPSGTVLNPAVGVGYLRFVSAVEASPGFGQRDIVVFEKLPYRVPPVQGIITLQAQTPLSHVNLLAKNRGTLNVALSSLKAIPELEALIGRLVRVDATRWPVTVRSVSEREAEDFWAREKISFLSVPAPDLSLESAVDLSREGADVHSVGAKAANYSLLLRQFPDYVRPASALPFSFYFSLLKATGADVLIHDLSQGGKWTVEQRNRKLTEIRERILAASEDAFPLGAELNRLRLSAYPGRRIRLRSSTNCEDLPYFNGAGLYVSNGISPTAGVKKLIRDALEVYASVWTPHAFEEREFYGIDHESVGMALLVHEAFSGEEANGVVLTLPQKGNASRGFPSLMAINVQPKDHSVTNPENGTVPEAWVTGDGDFRLESRSSIGDVFANRPEREEVLRRLKEVISEIEALFRGKLSPAERDSYGIDVEFKLMLEKGDLRIYVKQARLLRSGLGP